VGAMTSTSVQEAIHKAVDRLCKAKSAAGDIRRRLTTEVLQKFPADQPAVSKPDRDRTTKHKLLLDIFMTADTPLEDCKRFFMINCIKQREKEAFRNQLFLKKGR
jgi:hypothetical protein